MTRRVPVALSACVKAYVKLLRALVLRMSLPCTRSSSPRSRHNTRLHTSIYPALLSSIPRLVRCFEPSLPFAVASATPSAMAVGLPNTIHHAVDEEARAEVDVLNSRLDKTTQLTRKIQACLGRLEVSGQSVREVAGPLSGETKRLQLLGNSESRSSRS